MVSFFGYRTTGLVGQKIDVIDCRGTVIEPAEECVHGSSLAGELSATCWHDPIVLLLGGSGVAIPGHDGCKCFELGEAESVVGWTLDGDGM